MDGYPKTVKPQDVVGGVFSPGLYRIKGGRALYDEVWMADGGSAVYLVRLNPDLSAVRRWIDWDIELEQMFDVSHLQW